MVGHETDAHLNEKKKLINKTTQDVHGKPQRRNKKPRFEQEQNILAPTCIMQGKEINLQ